MVHGRTLWCYRAAATLGVGTALTGVLAITARVPALAMRAHRAALPSLRVDTGGLQGLGVPGRNMAPGDTVGRRLAITNTDDQRMRVAVVGTLRAGAAWGLDIRATRCSRPWTTNLATGRLECAGTDTAVSGWTRLDPGQPVTVPVGALAAGETAWLQFTLRLPSTAPSTVGGRSWIVDYRFGTTA
jgi:hypothetical protein